MGQSDNPHQEADPALYASFPTSTRILWAIVLLRTNHMGIQHGVFGGIRLSVVPFPGRAPRHTG